MKKIAILDVNNEDLGLKILFPDADYYILKKDIEDVMYFRNSTYLKYNINVNTDITKINSDSYDILLIICRSYDISKQLDTLNTINKIIDNNKFKNVCVFDNYDYDYDPNEYIVNDNINYFFKRNYNENKIYKQNVLPFPFIMFGHVSIIEKIDLDMVNDEKYLNYNNKKDRLFFTGSIFNHIDDEMKVYRNREKIYNQLSKFIYNPGPIYYEWYKDHLCDSKFSLDIIGVGDPNKRTFEILVSGSLLLSQYNNLKWPFDDRFSEHTIFKTPEEFEEKITLLQNNEELYKECLKKQHEIVRKYFNLDWIRNYILDYLK